MRNFVVTKFRLKPLFEGGAPPGEGCGGTAPRAGGPGLQELQEVLLPRQMDKEHNRSY